MYILCCVQIPVELVRSITLASESFIPSAKLVTTLNQFIFFVDGLKITVKWTMPDQAMKQQVMSQ